MRVTVRQRSLNPGKVIAMAICPIICLFYYLARSLDLACYDLRAQKRSAETISANVRKVPFTIFLSALEEGNILHCVLPCCKFQEKGRDKILKDSITAVL